MDASLSETLPGSDRAISDEEIVAQVLAGERAPYKLLVRRHNQKLFRAVRAVLRDDSEAEDVVQHTWVTAFHKLSGFRAEARFSTWLVRIGVNEAVGRLRTRKRHADLTLIEEADAAMPSNDRSPEDNASSAELARMLERHIDELPRHYRMVLMMRDVEELDTRETAACLGISEESVRVRLHRARHQLQESLTRNLGEAVADTFRFDGARCDRILAAVTAALDL